MESVVNLNDGHIHEALDRIFVAQNFLSQSLEGHPLIGPVPEFNKKVESAIAILAELYSEIGSYETINEVQNRANMVRWGEIQHPELDLPVYARTFAVGHDGTIFVPGEINNLPEKKVLLCSLSDSVRCLTYKNHKFYPSEWLSREFPETAEICSIIEAAAKKIISMSAQAQQA